MAGARTRRGRDAKPLNQVDAVPSRRDAWVVACVLAVVVGGVFLSVRSFEFVTYDDPLYVTDNPSVKAGLTVAGVAWAFTTSHAANWHPLTWLSHMLDVELFGVVAGAHHAVNALLHVLNT